MEIKKFNSRGHNQVFILMNPLKDETIELMHNSRKIVLSPGDAVELTERDIYKWLKRKYSYKGLCDLTKTAQDEEKYKSEKDFIKARKIEALSNYRKHLMKTLAREEQAANESAMNGSSRLDKMGFKAKKFEQDVESIEIEMEELMSPEPKKEKKVKDESRSDQDKSEKKA